MHPVDKIKELVEHPQKSFGILQVVIAVICIFIPLILMWCDRDTYYPQNTFTARLVDFQKCDSTMLTTFHKDTVVEWYKPGPEDIVKFKVCASPTEFICAVKIYKDRCGFRSSISHYTRSTRGYLFGMLYCMAAMLFIYNGVIYWKKRNSLDLYPGGAWYNVAIGLCLIAVILFPLNERKIPHVIFSVLFFVGNILVIVFVPNRVERKLGWPARAVIAIAVIALLVLLIKWRVLTVLEAEWIALTVIAIHLILAAISIWPATNTGTEKKEVKNH